MVLLDYGADKTLLNVRHSSHSAAFTSVSRERHQTAIDRSQCIVLTPRMIASESI